MLCRGLVRRHYGRFGSFRSLAQQPGVEFHIELARDCQALGDAGGWWGWQCRWWDLASGRAIGTTRKDKIVKAIRTTEEHLPGVTDWVLWTRRPLTPKDQKWYYGLSTDLTLHLWTADQVDEHLSGPGEIFRGTYFGDLVLVPDALEEMHNTAVASIRHRWMPDTHQPVDAERELRRVLGEAEPWGDLARLAEHLGDRVADLEQDATGLDERTAGSVDALAMLAREVIEAATESFAALESGDLDHLRERLVAGLPQPDNQMVVLCRRLRNLNHPASLPAVNILAHTAQVKRVLKSVESYMAVGVLVVVADAGSGKTHLAAQLTSAQVDRPAGVLLHGRDLHARSSLDDLAKSVVIQGSPVPSMEALVAALDAAGQRANRRLPVFIDGLNEAEDPRRWKQLLPTLKTILESYPYVLVVCTTRDDFVDFSLPDQIAHLEMGDFGHDTSDAVDKYFEHYKIDRGDAALPWEFLAHPLLLRLFCEVTNPERQSVVGVGAMPESLTALFERYLTQATQRVADLAPLTCQYSKDEAASAISTIGASLWKRQSRSIARSELRRELGEDGGLWQHSMVRALEHEGILVGARAEASDDIDVQIAFDALAGHLIADSMLKVLSSRSLESWLSDQATVAVLAGGTEERHPLAQDITRALAGLVPRRFPGMQFWTLAPEALRTEALFQTASLEAEYLDTATVDELLRLSMEPPHGPRDLFDRLRQARSAPDHPLNADALDSMLKPLPVADRDLRWTEWVRRRSKGVISDLVDMQNRWEASSDRTDADRLRAKWAMWTLTSTVSELRDQATSALFSFGMGDPESLFEMTLDALSTNDAYVVERMLAASYGVVMSHQLMDASFERVLAEYLSGLSKAFVGEAAEWPTDHWLCREYVRGTLALARRYCPDAIPGCWEGDKPITFASGPAVQVIGKEDERESEVRRTLHMDFKNYTLGRLIEDRRNYDFDDDRHQACVAHVLGLVWSLGWRASRFDSVEEDIARLDFRGDSARVERYGKKYGWSGFYTYAGQLVDGGELDVSRRLSDLHIDPSFPEAPSSAPPSANLLVDWTAEDDHSWITGGAVTAPDALLRLETIGEHPGAWVAVHGSLSGTDEMSGRQVWGLLHALLVDQKDGERLVSALMNRDDPGRWWIPEPPSDYYTFAGEIPWSPVFALNEDGDGSTEALYRRLVEIDDETSGEIEILAHHFSWESYHSHLNAAGGALVPSKLFSEAFDLRRIPRGFDQVTPEGRMAAISAGAPEGMTGNLLYIREDLLHQYAAGRCLVWLVWGERQLHPYREVEWLAEARRENSDIWKRVARASDVSERWVVS